VAEFNYDATNLSGETRDRLRFTIGDTVELRHLLADGELDHLLETYGTVWDAAIPAVDAMIAKASQQVGWGSGAERRDDQFVVRQLRQLRADLVDRGYPEPTTTTPGSHVVQLLRGYGADGEYVE